MATKVTVLEIFVSDSSYWDRQAWPSKLPCSNNRNNSNRCDTAGDVLSSLLPREHCVAAASSGFLTSCVVASGGDAAMKAYSREQSLSIEKYYCAV